MERCLRMPVAKPVKLLNIENKNCKFEVGLTAPHLGASITF